MLTHENVSAQNNHQGYHFFFFLVLLVFGHSAFLLFFRIKKRNFPNLFLWLQELSFSIVLIFILIFP